MRASTAIGIHLQKRGRVTAITMYLNQHQNPRHQMRYERVMRSCFYGSGIRLDSVFWRACVECSSSITCTSLCSCAHQRSMGTSCQEEGGGVEVGGRIGLAGVSDCVCLFGEDQWRSPDVPTVPIRCAVWHGSVYNRLNALVIRRKAPAKQTQT